MIDPVTTAGIGLLIALCVGATVQSWSRLRGRSEQAGVLVALWSAVGLGALALFVWRWINTSDSWQPLHAHVDGLLLITAVLVAALLYLTTTPRWIGVAAFGAPVVLLLLLWSFCAATWTYRPFRLDTLEPVWTGLHLACVYIGTATAALAAVAGTLYLYVHRRIKHKDDVEHLDRFASLEKLESTVQRSAALGFALLTVGLASGLVIMLGDGRAVAPGWWVSPKVVLAVLAWGAYAVLMNLRFTSTFRGRRAAYLAIGGFVLLLGVYGAVNAMPNALEGPNDHDVNLTAPPEPEGRA